MHLIFAFSFFLQEISSKNKNRLNRYHSQHYGNGSKCDLTQEPRKTEVRVSIVGLKTMDLFQYKFFFMDFILPIQRRSLYNTCFVILVFEACFFFSFFQSRAGMVIRDCLVMWLWSFSFAEV